MKKLPFSRYLMLWVLLAMSATGAERPNILWIIAEDMGPELGCYGTPEVHTPVLDVLAARSVRYTNAQTVTPVCSTARSSLMTGMFAMSIGAHNHRSNRTGFHPLSDGVRVLTDWYRPAGYTTANIKHLPTDNPDPSLYAGTGKTDWNFTYQSPVDPKLKPFDTDKWNDLKSHQPFYAQINFSETHRGKDWNTAHLHIDKQDWAAPEKVSIPPYYPDHPVTRAVWAQYLNNCMAVDKKVGYLRDLLKRDGLDKNTVIVFMGDHGRAMPRGKQWPHSSGLSIPLIIYWPEDNAALPTPEHYTRGTVTSQLVASIDVSATSLAMAGIPKPEKMQGRILFGPNKELNRDYLFAGRDRGDETVFHIRTAFDGRYRYIRNKYPERPFLQLNRYKEASYPIIGLMRYLHEKGQLTGPPAALMADSRPVEELYDLRADPWEIENLADNPDFGQVKAALSAQLEAWQNAINDQGRTPESDEEIAEHEAAMKKAYDKGLSRRAPDWFLSHPALGPYKIKNKS
ncbi:MAG: sulfatase [Verrucomicrobiales bacterium]